MSVGQPNKLNYVRERGDTYLLSIEMPINFVPNEKQRITGHCNLCLVPAVCVPTCQLVSSGGEKQSVFYHFLPLHMCRKSIKPTGDDKLLVAPAELGDNLFIQPSAEGLLPSWNRSIHIRLPREHKTGAAEAPGPTWRLYNRMHKVANAQCTPITNSW